jgi:hypothetical protein
MNTIDQTKKAREHPGTTAEEQKIQEATERVLRVLFVETGGGELRMTAEVLIRILRGVFLGSVGLDGGLAFLERVETDMHEAWHDLVMMRQ